MAFILGNFVRNVNRESADAPDKFKSIFVEKAIEFFSQNGYLPNMSVDYEPSHFLSEVAKEAGISRFAFPCKSSSIIRGGKPYAQCGYGNPLQELAAKKTP